jgi:hypothetical protein
MCMIWKKIPNELIETTPLNSAVFPIDSNTRYKKKRAQSTGTSLDYRMGVSNHLSSTLVN